MTVVEHNNAVDYFKDKIREYESRLSQIKAEIDVLRSEQNRVEDLLNSARLLLKDEQTNDQASAQNSTQDQSFSARLSILSLSDAIAEIISSSDGPIHAEQILKILREAGKLPRAKNPKNSIVSLVHRGIKNGRYRKVGPNLFESNREGN